MQDAQLTRLKRLQRVDIHIELAKMLGVMFDSVVCKNETAQPSEFQPKMRVDGKGGADGLFDGNVATTCRARIHEYNKNQIRRCAHVPAVPALHIPWSSTKRMSLREEILQRFAAVCRLVEQKLDEYAAPATVITYSSSIAITQEVIGALDCQAYYRDVGDTGIKDEIWKARERADGSVVVATNAFGLRINRPDVRVAIHIGPIYQLRSYGQKSGQAGRNGKRSEAMILIAVGIYEAMQKAHEQTWRWPATFHISTTAKEKQRMEQQKVE